MAEPTAPLPASFRDPSGFVFEMQGQLYRQVNQNYADQYRQLMESGLYQELTQKKWLVPHLEIRENLCHSPEWHITLKPERLPFVSYPYEWCFGQLRDAARLTLQVMQTAMKYGMTLKDASPFNILFNGNQPVFIDTLSFEPYRESEPWVAYRQFCECFLFPLLLQHYRQTDSTRWLRVYMNGIPLDITAQLLPWRSRLNLGTWMHVFLQRTVTHRQPSRQVSGNFGKAKLNNLLSHLGQLLNQLKPAQVVTSSWRNYYSASILGKDYLVAKDKLFRSFIEDIPACFVHDMGANEGYFSLILASKGHRVLATDADSACIEYVYEQSRMAGHSAILPLVADISNPSPALGFANRERMAFDQRFSPDLLVALALVHHLAIAANIPLPLQARYFSQSAPLLIIEFVPKHDPKVRELLNHKADVYPNYNQEQFESSFTEYFTILQKEKIPGSERFLYKMARN